MLFPAADLSIYIRRPNRAYAVRESGNLAAHRQHIRVQLRFRRRTLQARVRHRCFTTQRGPSTAAQRAPSVNCTLVASLSLVRVPARARLHVGAADNTRCSLLVIYVYARSARYAPSTPTPEESVAPRSTASGRSGATAQEHEGVPQLQAAPVREAEPRGQLAHPGRLRSASAWSTTAARPDSPVPPRRREAARGAANRGFGASGGTRRIDELDAPARGRRTRKPRLEEWLGSLGGDALETERAQVGRGGTHPRRARPRSPYEPSQQEGALLVRQPMRYASSGSIPRADRCAGR